MTHRKQLMGVARLGALVKFSPWISQLDCLSHARPPTRLNAVLECESGDIVPIGPAVSISPTASANRSVTGRPAKRQQLYP
jgi:hypothetical protein